MPESIHSPSSWQIVPQGDRSLLLVFGQGISVEIGQRCATAAAALRSAAIRGISDIVPAFDSVALHYQPAVFGASTSFQRLAADIDNILNKAFSADIAAHSTRQIDIPVCYGGTYGPDLADVATHCGLTQSQVIALHSQGTSYVFMLGFAPGAPYIGLHDEKLAIGRRATPRTAVPAGSVAIANLQTMIYPNVSPGGWHIIGSTPLVLFDLANEPAALLAPGDTVRFLPVSPAQYVELQQGQQ